LTKSARYRRNVAAFVANHTKDPKDRASADEAMTNMQMEIRRTLQKAINQKVATSKDSIIDKQRKIDAAKK
jgi:hypothetical protein